MASDQAPVDASQVRAGQPSPRPKHERSGREREAWAGSPHPRQVFAVPSRIVRRTTSNTPRSPPLRSAGCCFAAEQGGRKSGARGCGPRRSSFRSGGPPSQPAPSWSRPGPGGPGQGRTPRRSTVLATAGFAAGRSLGVSAGAEAGQAAGESQSAARWTASGPDVLMLTSARAETGERNRAEASRRRRGWRVRAEVPEGHRPSRTLVVQAASMVTDRGPVPSG